MNPVEKETAESFLRERRARLSADAAMRWSQRIWCACWRISPTGAEGAYAGKASEERSFQAKSSLPKKAKSFLLGGAGGIRTHGPRKANGFRVRLVMTTSILLHDEMISGDG